MAAAGEALTVAQTVVAARAVERQVADAAATAATAEQEERKVGRESMEGAAAPRVAAAGPEAATARDTRRK